VPRAGEAAGCFQSVVFSERHGDGESPGSVMWRIRQEFDQMPGLCINRAQAEQLWQLERSATAIALEALVAIGYLRITRQGFVRADMFH
jgi:hypothetical protein